MPNAEYPPLPEPVDFCVDKDSHRYDTWTADQMHAYLATERQRIEREVKHLAQKYGHACVYNTVEARERALDAILRAIRGEKP